MPRRAVLLGAIALGAACASRPVSTPEPEVTAWAAALATADREAALGRYAAADSVLESFHAAHPSSPDTLELLLRRALYLIDPGNPDERSAARALPLLDRYLGAEIPEHRRAEIDVVRRLAAVRTAPVQVRVDTVALVDTVAARAAVSREIETRERLRDEELLRLRDSLTRTTAELERIRRRLAPQRP
jgi:hypothetical protein